MSHFYYRAAGSDPCPNRDPIVGGSNDIYRVELEQIKIQGIMIDSNSLKGIFQHEKKFTKIFALEEPLWGP